MTRQTLRRKGMSHAETRILRRVLDMYDLRRSWFPGETEYSSRELAVGWLSKTARIDYVDAAELIADALARRAGRTAKRSK